MELNRRKALILGAAGFGLAGECDDAPHSIGDEDEHGRCQGGVAMNHS